MDDLRDFCNGNGIPGRRSRYWSTSTWNSLLQPNTLLKYCGYGVWNVHRRNGTKRPPSEWVIVENAHEALITQEEALAIAGARRRNGKARFDKGYSRSEGSPYLLSGGLFTCGRCGANMVGRRNGRHDYYVCGSQRYRKGMGCGPGVYVPKSEVEAEVIDGLRELVGVCSDPQGFTKHVNEELRTIWESSDGHDPHAEEKLSAVEARSSNIRQAIEDGLADTSWANGRLVELDREKTALQAHARRTRTQPQIDAEAAISYRRDLARVFRHGKLPQRKSLVRAWVQELQLAPEDLTVHITYQVPEPVVNSVVARALYAAMHNQVGALLRRTFRLPMKGRRVRAGR